MVCVNFLKLKKLLFDGVGLRMVVLNLFTYENITNLILIKAVEFVYFKFGC